MKKILAGLLLSALVMSNLSALEVDKSELQKANDTTIEFINYTGPHKVIDSKAAIIGIGSSLGKIISDTTDKSADAGSSNKYYVIHAIDPNETDKLDADILFIGADATVDHIDNLRRIISGYLSSAYGYSEKDSDTLAVFITVYNAVYRGNLDVFGSKYKKEVNKHLSSNCGLSINYKDWPGKSEIIIPLYDVKNGGLSTVDTSVISDSKVVSSMKEDDDRNVESRKDMVDIKEREAEQATEKAQAAQKTAVEEQKKAKEEKQKTEEVKKEATEAKKDAEEKQKIAEENPEDKQAQKDAEEAKKKAEEADEAVVEQEKKQEEQEKKAEEAKQEAKEEQAKADKKQTEAQNERKEIAKDQREVQKREAELATTPTEFGLVIADEKEMLSRLVKFNTQNGEIVKNSPVSVIRNRTIFKGEENYIAIAGENVKNGTIKLVTLDTEKMEIISESEAIIAQDSVLVKDGSDYYCIIDDKGSYYVGKFDESLTLNLKSPSKVKSCTPITITDSGIVVTDENGKLMVLDPKDLTNIATGK